MPPPPSDSARPRAGCPDEEQLAELVEGKLTNEAADRLEAHIDACAGCYHVLASFARDRAASGTTDGARDTSHVGRVAALQAARPLPHGTVVGRFVVAGWLGQGASGAVYAAHDVQLDRTVALKLTPPVAAEEHDHVRTRVLAEARAMGRVVHPNVVTVHEVGTFESRLYIAMERVEGRTLRDWLGEKRRSRDEILRVFVDAGAGLLAAHQAGIVHRDFKPSNVLVGDDGRVRVTDFGLAQLLSESGDGGADGLPGRARVIAGTPAFMAPEQGRGEGVDARSDQFSFCRALSLALGPDVAGLRVRAALRRGLAHDPRERFASMVDLLAELTPRRRERAWRAIFVGAAALAFASGVVAYREHRTTTAMRLCHGAEETMNGVWSAERQETVRRTFLASGDPYAADAWRAVKRTLDAYGTEWVAASEEACSATNVRQEQPRSMLDLRTACLTAHLDEMREVVDVFSSADVAVVNGAASAVHELAPLARCADVRALSAREPLPANPAIAAEVRAVAERLARTRAEMESGRYGPGLEMGSEALAMARHAGYRPQIAEALFILASGQRHVGAAVESAENLYAAASLADAVGDDRLRARVLIDLLFEEGHTAGKEALIPLLQQQGAAAIERLGGDLRLEAQLHRSYGVALAFEERLPEARAEMERALRLAEEVRATSDAQRERDSLDAEGARMTLAQLDSVEGQPAAAITRLDRVIDHLTPIVGASHLNVTLAYMLKADAEVSNLDFTAASRDAEHAATTFAAANGESGYYWAVAATSESDARTEAGEADRAIVLATGAVKALEGLSKKDGALGDALGCLGRAYAAGAERGPAVEKLEQALVHSYVKTPVQDGRSKAALADLLVRGGGDRRRAHALALEARTAFAASPQDPRCLRDRSRLEEWLANHPPR